MPKSVTARSRERGHEPTSTGVDELIQRGRGQGHISLPELRAAFGRAGISPAEGRSIIRELTEAGVQLGNEPAGDTAPGGAAGTGKEAMKTAKPAEKPDAADLIGLDGLDTAAAEAAAATVAAQAAAAEVDLDDQTSAMGDSVTPT